MTQSQRAAWFFTVLVTLVAFGLVVPQLPALGDQTRTLDADTEVGMATGSVVIPARWEVDIAATSQQTPVASMGGVEVTIADAAWLGGSSGLLDNVARLLFDGDAVVPEIDTDDADAEGGEPSREVWQLTPSADAADDAPVWVDVVREGEGVALVVVRGDAAEAEVLTEQIDEIRDSITLDLSTVDVEVAA
ncbi:hypothetical protein LGT39_10850 [Demequina sp. TTPB684]|uniref:hypothetical protein n=1 Tax=unclassified Demequina TaxID=2620311 RepID=UPI001CF147ED|nr:MULTISPECIES: hypothetical protein [unclassified Demequina]MCB2413342.1 hypothetical protein [Demequina sp. TTPB684]UPU87480.1 hypothetical protein LGT36_009420 [Demequina sp. TMPB413]